MVVVIETVEYLFDIWVGDDEFDTREDLIFWLEDEYPDALYTIVE